MSTFLYLVYINALITELQESNLGTKVMFTTVSNPSFADDISLTAFFPINLQKMTDIVYKYCKTWCIDINVNKSNVIVFSKKRQSPAVGIMYGEHFFPQVKSLSLLGITHDSNMKQSIRINERMVGQSVNPKESTQWFSQVYIAKLYSLSSCMEHRFG